MGHNIVVMRKSAEGQIMGKTIATIAREETALVMMMIVKDGCLRGIALITKQSTGVKEGYSLT